MWQRSEGDKKIDSLMRANKIRPRTVQEVIRIETNYTDTVPKIIPLIPIDTTLYSGGISFKLSISDSLRVSNITSNNSNTLIIYKKWKWFKRTTKYMLATDYGESEFDRIIITK